MQKRGALLVSPGRGIGSKEFGSGAVHETSLCCLSCPWRQVTRDGIAERLCFGVKYTLGVIIILYSTFAGQYDIMKALQSSLLLTK